MRSSRGGLGWVGEGHLWGRSLNVRMTLRRLCQMVPVVRVMYHVPRRAEGGRGLSVVGEEGGYVEGRRMVRGVDSIVEVEGFGR